MQKIVFKDINPILLHSKKQKGYASYYT